MWVCVRGLAWVLLLVGCGQHYEEGAHPPPKPPPQTQLPPGHPPLDQAPAASPSMPVDHPPLDSPPPAARETDEQVVFSGELRIADHLTDRLPAQATLFIIARPAPTGGPPVMVKRLPMPAFPYVYRLTEMDGMMPGQPVDFSDIGGLYLTARIDLDGSVGPPQPGDMEGAAAQNPVPVGSRDADIVIDRIY